MKIVKIIPLLQKDDPCQFDEQYCYFLQYQKYLKKLSSFSFIDIQ